MLEIMNASYFYDKLTTQILPNPPGCYQSDYKDVATFISKSSSNLSKWLWNPEFEKDPLAIPLNQKIAFGVSLASLGYKMVYGDDSSLGMLLLASQVGLSLYEQIQSPTLSGVASLVAPFTPLRPLAMGVSSLYMGWDICKQTAVSLSHLNRENYLTVGRNLLVYGVNGLTTGKNLFNTSKSLWPSSNAEELSQAKQLLNLDQTANPTPQEIKAAFRKASVKAHPDKGGNKEAFEALTQAKEVLLNTKSLVEKTSSVFSSFFSTLDSYLKFPGAEAVSLGEPSSLEIRVQEALESGLEWTLIDGTNSGSYRLGDLAIFKPSSERNFGPENREIAKRGKDLSLDEVEEQKWVKGFTAEKQYLATLFDFGSVAKLPQGHITHRTSDQFAASKISEKMGFEQEIILGAIPLVELHPLFAKNPTEAYNSLKNHPILQEVPLEEFQKIALLDALLYNEDRHLGNILVVRDLEGKPHLRPIDMDMILPGSFSKIYTGLFKHPRIHEPFTQENLDFIRLLSPDEVFEKVKSIALPDLAAKQAKILALVIQEFAAKGFSLGDIYTFISDSSRLSELVEHCNKQEAQEFWSFFEKGLARELSIATAKKTRNIIFGTTYVSNNPDRDALSQLVSANQQRYAKIWDLEGRVVTDNLLKGKCNLPSGSTADCVPYWNKVELIRNWLNEPNNAKEEWYILADDDMPVTNMNVDPYEALDLLRKGQDASIIIVRDVVNWKGDKDLSVNTGLFMVRKDMESKKFFEKLWVKRNDPTSNPSSSICPTLGTCKNQEVLHEQEGFARVLSNSRSLLEGTVAVIDPRDLYQEKEIALNTFKREGCFIRVQEGWSENSISYSHDASNPNGAWQPGDWMGQTAGVPIKGKDCYSNEPKQFRLDYLNFMLQNSIAIDDPIRSKSVKTNKNLLLHIDADSLEIAITVGDLNRIKSLLEDGPISNGDRREAVRTAALAGQLDIVELLLENAPFSEWNRGDAVRTVAEAGRLDIVKFLLENGPIPEWDRRGAVRTAALAGQLDIVELLLENDPFSEWNRGLAVENAAEKGRLDIIKLLLENGPILESGCEEAVTIAAEKGHLDIIKLLLENGPISHDYRGKAVTIAAEKGHLDRVKLLLESGTIPLWDIWPVKRKSIDDMEHNDPLIRKRGFDLRNLLIDQKLVSRFDPDYLKFCAFNMNKCIWG